MNEQSIQSTSLSTEVRSFRYLGFYVPLLLLLGFTLVVRWLDLDLETSALFYRDGDWLIDDNVFVQLLYRYGTFPTFITAFVALLVCVGSWLWPAWKQRRPLCSFIVLCMLVGPGLLVNTLIKEVVGRPRPRDVMQFGGDHTFMPVGDIQWLGPHSSFPSGHASMGFFWLCLAIYFWRRQRRLALGFAVLGMVHGALMGFGRIVQGGHFLSDVVWAGGIVYLSAWLIYHYGGFDRTQ